MAITKLDETKKIKLDDIAGYEEEKAEIRKIVKLLNNYKKYSKQGIYIPRGLILQGPPGCGKTLLAKAIAGECNIPFFSYQPTGTVEDVLSGLKEAFDNAHKKIPSVVYLDEINEIVTTRRFNSDSARRVLQFVLTELDGFKTHPGVMVIASTNCYDDLPRSLLRSGRMDKKMKIDLPDLSSREAIISYYIKDYPIFNQLNVRSLAAKLKGMSGSDIKTLVNNALIEYVDEKEFVKVEDFAKLINDMNFETIGKRWRNKEVVKKIIAHEVGHSLVSGFLRDDYGSISAIKYDGVAGFTSFGDEILEDEDEEIKEIYGKKELLDEICVALGGMAGELVYYGFFDTGVGGDVDHIKNVFEYGANSAIFGFEPITEFWREECEGFKKRYERIRNHIFKKQLKRAIKIIKKQVYLGRYLIDLTMESSDVLTEKQMAAALEHYLNHKAEIKNKYKNYKLKLTEEGEE